MAMPPRARRQAVDVALADADLARVVGSRPAMMRSSVVLPQPEGPSSTTNSWSRTSRLTDLSASTWPNTLRTPSARMPLMAHSSR